MFKLILFCTLATFVASKPSTLISSGTSSITTEEKTEIRHHLPLTEVHVGAGPILKTAEILTPSAEILQPISHQFRSEIHKPLIKTTEIIGSSAKIAQPYLNIVPGVVSHQFRSDYHGAPLLKTAEIVSPIKSEIFETKPLIELKSSPGVIHSTKTELIGQPLLKTSSIISHPLTETHIIGGSPLIRKTEILEETPLLKKSEISHSYVESTKIIGGPHAVLGYSPLSKVAISPYGTFGADPLLIPSIGGAEYLIHQPLRYL